MTNLFYRRLGDPETLFIVIAIVKVERVDCESYKNVK